MPARSSSEDLYWSLCVLMTGFGAELTARRAAAVLDTRPDLLRGVRVQLTGRRPAAVAQRLVAVGARPVVHVDVRQARDDRFVGALADAGVADLVLAPAGDLAAAVRAVSRHRRICGLGIACHHGVPADRLRVCARLLRESPFTDRYLVVPAAAPSISDVPVRIAVQARRAALLALAAEDRGCAGVHLILPRPAPRALAWATALEQGRYVVEEDHVIRLIG